MIANQNILTPAHSDWCRDSHLTQDILSEYTTYLVLVIGPELGT